MRCEEQNNLLSTMDAELDAESLSSVTNNFQITDPSSTELQP